MAKKDLEYLLSQARRIAEHREEGAEDAIFKEYKKLLKSLKSYIAEVHVKYAAANGSLSFADLQKAGYDARFLEEIEQRIAVATPKAAKELRQLVKDTYELAYKSMVEGVEKVANGADLGETFSEAVAITPEQIRNAVNNPYMEIALQKNHNTIIYDIRQAVAVGLMNGDRYTTMAHRISEKVDGAYYKSVRIARTEAHRVREAGNNDAAVNVDKELQNGDSGLRMVKVWKTMKDERVRPQRRRKGKGGWSTRMGKGANHMKLEGQIVLADESFDLLDGSKADCPGSSGVAGHDINCRCYVSYEMMTDAEYFTKTGKHFPGAVQTQKALDKEKVLLDEQTKLQAERDAAKAKMQSIGSREYSDIWVTPLSPKDYEQFKDTLSAMRKHYKSTGQWDMVDICDAFETSGKQYMQAKGKFEAAEKRLAALNDDLAKIRGRYGLEEDKFSKARKDKAYWFTGDDARERADKVLRPDTSVLWQSASQEERRAANEYTAGSGPFNRPLRGFAGNWNNFQGIGKVSLDYENRGADIQHLTDIIDRNPSKFDIWLQRGISNNSGIAGFLGIEEDMLNASEADLQQLLFGKVVKDEAFTSTAAAKGSGFNKGKAILNIYAPKGTKMIYAEPFSEYGNGAKSSWDGISEQLSFGREFEVILQRGTSFKITKVEKGRDGILYIDVDVVGQ